MAKTVDLPAELPSRNRLPEPISVCTDVLDSINVFASVVSLTHLVGSTFTIGTDNQDRTVTLLFFTEVLCAIHLGSFFPVYLPCSFALRMLHSCMHKSLAMGPNAARQAAYNTSRLNRFNLS